MSFSVTMPALGESVSEGTVTRWLKQEGEQVEVDEPLLEVSTDKVDTEIPSPAAGVLQRIVVGEDETVAVGAELAVIGDDAGNASTEGAGGGQQASAGAGQDGGSATADRQGFAPQGAQQAAPPAPDQSGAQYPAAPADVPTAFEQPQQLPQPGAEQPDGQQSGGTAAGDASSGAGGTASETPVTMPALGESVTEGTVTRWLKQVGDSVEVDEPLLEVSTDKVDTEIPSPVAGTILSIAVGEDETVPVGAELAVVGEPGAQNSGAPQPAAEPEQPPAQQATTEAQQPPAAPQQAAPAPDGQAQPADGNGYVTPLVRKLAAEHGVDLASLQGTGIGGRIRKQDVLEAARAQREEAERRAAAERQAAAQPSAEPAPPAQPPAQPSVQPSVQPAAAASAPSTVSPLRGTTEKMSRLRKVIAQRMVESLQVSAQLTTVVEVDITPITRLRDRAKRDFEAREGVKLSFLPFFAKAAVEALKAHPKVNASIDGDQIVYHGQENLGVAVDTDRGLLVPVIRDAGDLNIAGLARKIADLAARTRSGKIGPDELSGGTFTLTNTGSRGALFDTPIINQPQVGILGTGAVVKRPVVVDHPDLGETIAVRSMVYLALSYDHRIVDGADAARFLTAVKQRLEDGRFEGDLGL